MFLKDLSPDFLASYFTGLKRSKSHAISVKKYEALKVHANGEYPRYLIDERRPNEIDKIKDYRQKIYEPVTQDSINRVLSSLTKIRRSADWSVVHPTENFPPSIPENERLAEYADNRLPIAESVESWLFSVALKNYLLDANAIIFVSPSSYEIGEGEYEQPFPVIFNSPSIIEYIPNSLLIVRLSKTSSAEQPVESSKEEFLVVTQDSIQNWKRADQGYTLVKEVLHTLQILPAFKTQGAYFSNEEEEIIFCSRISPMLPRLNDAAREYSDMQAEVVQHIHSEKWEWASDKCPSCRNSAGIPTGFSNHSVNGAKKIVCSTCKGNLLVPSSPYLSMQIRPTNAQQGEANAPIPPAGYITKSIDIVKIQDERIDKHLYKALASINMHFLDQSPLSQSGVAKEVDRDELNNFVYSVAEDLVRIMQLTYNLIVEYRYKAIVPDTLKRYALRPRISVPEKYDLLSSSYLSSEIKAVRDSSINPLIISTLEAEYAAKKFYNEPKIRDLIQLVLTLDPLAGITEEDKMVRLNNGGIDRLDYVISSNILSLVKQAMVEPKFLSLSTEKQSEQLTMLAQKIVDKIDGAKIPIV